MGSRSPAHALTADRSQLEEPPTAASRSRRPSSATELEPGGDTAAFRRAGSSARRVLARFRWPAFRLARHSALDESEQRGEAATACPLGHPLSCLASRGGQLHRPDDPQVDRREADVRRRAAAPVGPWAAGSPRFRSRGGSRAGARIRVRDRAVPVQDRRGRGCGDVP